MQESFLTLYPKLIQTNKNIPLSGLWLAHGDEPLVQQWLTDAMRPIWQEQNLAIKRVELVSVKTWQEVLAQLNSLSLFDDATAVIVTGNHKPDISVQTQLEQFAIEANGGSNQNCVLWVTGKVDKRAQSSKWFVPFAKFGNVIDCNLYNENQRQQLLSTHAKQFSLSLTAEAWQFLMVQTEHHLLGAYQALWRLSYLLTPVIMDSAHDNSKNNEANNQSVSANMTVDAATRSQPSMVTVDVATLQEALVSNAHYSVFDLSDAILAGDALKVVKIIEQLRAADEPTPLVLWALSKDMRLIMQLMDGQDTQSLGIWRNKQNAYHQASRRHSAQTISDWPDIIYNCDKAIKGLIRQPAWELILQAALGVTGHRLFF